MQDLSLFNIGFRCEAICESLRRYKAEGIPLTPRMLDESLQVIDDCFSINDNISSFFSTNRAELAEFLPLVFELFPGFTPEKIIAHLQKTKGILESIGKKESSVGIEEAIQLFRKISALCLRRNTLVNTGFTPILTLAI